VRGPHVNPLLLRSEQVKQQRRQPTLLQDLRDVPVAGTMAATAAAVREGDDRRRLLRDYKIALQACRGNENTTFNYFANFFHFAISLRGPHPAPAIKTPALIPFSTMTSFSRTQCVTTPSPSRGTTHNLVIDTTKATALPAAQLWIYCEFCTELREVLHLSKLRAQPFI
jgi:hypothetical protein